MREYNHGTFSQLQGKRARACREQFSSLSAIASDLLQMMIICNHGKPSPLAEALGTDRKGKLSPGLYQIPDQRIERMLLAKQRTEQGNAH